jgi:hypothetical protein
VTGVPAFELHAFNTAARGKINADKRICAHLAASFSGL